MSRFKGRWNIRKGKLTFVSLQKAVLTWNHPSTFNMYVEGTWISRLYVGRRRSDVRLDRQSTNRCLDYLAETDPCDIKTDIYQTRGAALKASYDWILHHPQFQCWCNSSDSQLLWIRGDPGKGKIMLLCGIIDELRPTTKLGNTQTKTFLSFFFC